jgi:cell division protease FtsH
MNKETRFNIWYVIAALIGVMILHTVIAEMASVTAIPYSEFQKYLQEGKVAEASVSDREVEGTLKENLPNGSNRFRTTRVEPDFASQLQKHDVKFNGAVESNVLGTLLSWLMPVLLFVGVWWFLMRRIAANQGFGGGLMQIGKSKARICVETDTKVTFRRCRRRR